MKICRRCLITGKVQGVFYRASAAEQAKRLGVVGYAKNLPDGSVEVLACGEEAEVRELIDSLWKGPSAARVSDVVVVDVECNKTMDSFTTT